MESDIIGVNPLPSPWLTRPLEALVSFGSLMLFILLYLIWTSSLAAQPTQIDSGGFFKYRITGQHYNDDSTFESMAGQTEGLNSYLGRTVNQIAWGSWQFDLDGEGVILQGPFVNATSSFSQGLAPLLGSGNLVTDNRELLRMSKEYSLSGDSDLGLRIDRAALSYATDTSVLRIGRQVVSLGDGLVFQVLDLISPFSPYAIDREYKRGQDMLYGQYLFSTTQSVEVLAAPRRNIDTQEVEEDQSTSAAVFKTRFEPTSTDIQSMLGRDYGSWFVGLGSATPLGEGILRLDLRLTRISTNNSPFSAVINYDHSWMILDKNVYGFIEYYRNGFGLSDINLNSIESNKLALEQLARGVTYTLGQNLSAIGTRIELHPLVNSYLSVITNLDDLSQYAQGRVEIDLLQDLVMIIGTNIPVGNSNSEYGGIALPDGSNTKPATEGFLQLGYYW